jgi:hypothetical protein
LRAKQDDAFFGDFEFKSLWDQGSKDSLIKVEQLIRALSTYNVWIVAILTRKAINKAEKVTDHETKVYY